MSSLQSRRRLRHHLPAETVVHVAIELVWVGDPAWLCRCEESVEWIIGKRPHHLRAVVRVEVVERCGGCGRLLLLLLLLCERVLLLLLLKHHALLHVNCHQMLHHLLLLLLLLLHHQNLLLWILSRLLAVLICLECAGTVGHHSLLLKRWCQSKLLRSCWLCGHPPLLLLVHLLLILLLSLA